MISPIFGWIIFLFFKCQLTHQGTIFHESSFASQRCRWNYLLDTANMEQLHHTYYVSCIDDITLSDVPHDLPQISSDGSDRKPCAPACAHFQRASDGTKVLIRFLPWCIYVVVQGAEVRNLCSKERDPSKMWGRGIFLTLKLSFQIWDTLIRMHIECPV